MNMNDLFNELQLAGVKVSYDEGRLDLKLPKGLAPELKAKLVKHKKDFRLFLVSMFKNDDSKIKPVKRNDTNLVTSFSQQRLWFIDQLQAGSAEYNMPTVFNVQGELDVSLVNRVFTQIMTRHEVLRTVYVEVDGEVMQRICPMSEIDFAINVEDLRECTGETQSSLVKEKVEADFLKVFDLANDVMLRVSYLTTAQDAGVLMFNMHHIASDGWSMEVLTKEFFALFDALSNGLENPLPELEIQYADYAHWQRTHLEGEVLDKQLSYWAKQLDEVPAVHSLPLSFPRPDEKQHVGAMLTGSLSADVSKQLQALVKQHQLTLYMLLHGALSLLLSRHSNSSDIVIGTPMANRTQKELTPLIGFFVNTLVLRADTNHDTLSDYFKHIKQVHMDAQANQDVPFEQLVDMLKIPRGTNHSPLIQIMMTTNTDYGVDSRTNEGATKLSKLTLSPFEAEQEQSKFDLDIIFSVHDEGIEINWVYDVSLFSEQDITRLSTHLCRLLTGLGEATDGGVAPHSLPMQSAEEAHHLITQLNDTLMDYPAGKCIHELFEAQAKDHPDNVALVFEDTRLTYKALNEQTNQLAHYLIAQGIEKGDFVAVCAERGVEFVVAVLAILKAGGAYMPLDPSNPSSRLSYMVADAKPKLMLVSQTQGEVLAEIAIEQLVLCTHETQMLLSKYDDSNPDRAVSANELAYVIYTSGSTGEPKGVLVEQQSVIQLVCGQDYYQAGVGDVVAFCANPAFDATTWELWGSLLNGAQLVAVTNDLLLNGLALKAYLIEHQVNVLHLTVGLFNQHADALMDFYPGLDYLLFGGEKADPAKVREVIKGGMPKHLVQCYGPTETTTFASTQRIESLPESALTVSIGTPIANTQIYILNSQLQPVPKGVEGELYIGGDGLARGYLNQDELTKKSFIENPFYEANNASHSKRLYKSGDLARLREDGQIEYQGRADQQVKIRGLRIELGEIESQLEKIEVVDSAKVLSFKQGHESKIHACVRLKDELVQHDSFEKEISSWNSLFSRTYENSSVSEKASTDEILDTSGWVSSYTGKPLSKRQMEAWANETVERIRLLAPKKILEIGCGTGMLLLQYANFCDEVYAVDISEPAIEQVQKKVDLHQWKHVNLAVGDAYSVAGLAIDDFDLIVINSVAQYFPSESYLNKVIDLSLEKLTAQGNIFIGDVRNFDLTSLFATRVMWERRQPEWSTKEFNRRVSKKAREETELLLSPSYFHKLKETNPLIEALDIWVKDTVDDNEMSSFRFDVTLRKSVEKQRQAITWVDNLSQAQKAMSEGADCVYGLRGMQNPNLLLSKRIDNILSDQGELFDGQTSLDLDNVELTINQSTDFFELQQRCAQHNYAVAGSCSLDDIWLIDCILYPEGFDINKVESLNSPPVLQEQLFNKPYLHTLAARLIPQLKKALQDFLPVYMIPHYFNIIDEWPLTPNGKLDIKALPEPDDIALQGDYVAPQTETEKVLVEIWSALLNKEADEISCTANFFDLGGHSLMIIRLLNKIKHQLDLSMDVQALYQVNDIQALAQLCDSIIIKMRLADRLAQHDESDLEEVEF